MSQVTEFAFAGPSQDPGPTHRTIRRASVGFDVLFTVLFGALGVLAIAMMATMLVYTGQHLQVTNHSFIISNHNDLARGARYVSALPMATKVAYALVTPVRSLPILMVFWNLRALFRLYARGYVFTRDNSLHIQKVGLWLIAAAFAPFVCHLGLSLTGNEIDLSWFHMDEVQELILGGLVFVIAQVMQVGREIEEDRSQFV